MNKPENLTLFTHPSAPNFKATIKPESYGKLVTWFSKTDKQRIAKHTTKQRKTAGKYESDAVAVLQGKREPRVTYVQGVSLDEAVNMDRLELVRKVASCPYSETEFWAEAWQMRSIADGLHIWQPDPVEDDEVQS